MYKKASTVIFRNATLISTTNELYNSNDLHYFVIKTIMQKGFK